MMKLSHFVMSRSAVSEKLLLGKVSNIRDPLWSHSFITRAGISTSGLDLATDGTKSSRIFAEYTLFKGKAALSMSPILPKFSKNDYGSLKVNKRGCIILNFWPAVGERKYDWQKKQAFALSATELGSLISLGPAKSCEFFHDPSMKTSNAGQVRKSLSVTPLSDDNGYFFTLTVANTVQKTNERFSVPVTTSEFTVMRTAFSFILPHIMGWDQFSNQSPVSTDMKSVGQPELQLSPNLEWDR